MNTHRPQRSVSRRAALGGLGAAGLGVAITATVGTAAAQDATSMPTAGHPIVGTWIIDRDLTSTAEVPTVVVFTADGGFVDPGQGVAGAWEATGPRSAAMTIVPFIANGDGGYGVVRATWDVDESSETMSGPATVTILTPDGTVVATGDLSSRATRLRVEPMENKGKPLADFPMWTPAPPATPTP